MKIALSQNRFALIDNEDSRRALEHTWWLLRNQDGKEYAVTQTCERGVRKTIYLHRFVMNAPTGIMVDHRFGNTLDCRKSKLRFADKFQNQWNKKRQKSKSGFKGVTRNGKNRWMAKIEVKGKTIYLGNFQDPKDAAKAYDRGAKEHFGEFAEVNFK